jgi:hypothetical protein
VLALALSRFHCEIRAFVLALAFALVLASLVKSRLNPVT